MSKLDVAIDQRKEGVVATYTDVVSRFDLCAALADDDAAGGNQLPIVAFYTQHFGLAVPAIAGATHTFFMCHSLFLCLAFSLLNLLRAAPAGSPLLFRLHFFRLRSFGYFSSRCLCLDRLRQRWNFYLFHGRKFLFPCCGSLACNQALAIGNNIVDCEKGKLLAMTPTMPITLLSLILENNYLFAAALPAGSCQHRGIVHQRRADHSVVGI